MHGMKQSWEHQGHDGKGEHARTHAGTGTIEPELAPSSPTDDEGESQDQEEIAENAPGNRSLDQADQTGAQCDNRDDELGGVAKRGVEETADRGTSSVGQMFGGLPHVSRQWQDAEAGRDEDREGRRVEYILEQNAGGYREQQQLAPAQ